MTSTTSPTTTIDPRTPSDLSMLVGPTYRSTSVTGHALTPGSVISLWVTPMQIVGAQIGCNSMGVASRIEDGRLIADGQQSGSLLPCDDEHQAQDEWFLGFLTSHPTITLDGATLVLADDAVSVTFMRADPAAGATTGT